MFRIPGKLSEKKKDLKLKPPVLLQHGMTQSSDMMILNRVDKAPAFVLAEAGYDVWLGNLRGNKYCQKHDSIDPKTDPAKFYDFDQSHHSRFDLVSMIDYVKV